MQNMASGASAYYDMSPWEIGLIIGDVIIGILVAGGVIWMILRTKDEKKHPEKYKRVEVI